MSCKIQIYAMTHKPFTVPSDLLYVPLQVGSAVHEDLGYLRDDDGDHISQLNCYYSELTGLYWIWKNVADLDYVGTCHYRRYLLNEQGFIFTRQEYEALLKEYDLITTRKVLLNNSYHYGFSANHNIVALDTTGEVIKELFPEYYETFINLVNGSKTYFGNIFVTSKALYDEYCNWLFTIFFEVQRHIDLETDEDAYHKRVFGFISEFLLYVWTQVKRLKVYECKVGMIGEKAETKEIKLRLAEFLSLHDIEGAKEFFLAEHKKRPDILMEASDITGELHIAMQIIATADAEKKAKKKTILDQEDDLFKLIPWFVQLNQAVTSCAQNRKDQEALKYIKNMDLSDTAIAVAVAIYPNTAINKEELLEWLIQQRL